MTRLKKLQHKCEYFLFRYFMLIFSSLPFRFSINLAAFIVSALAFLFKADKIAQENLQMIFPAKDGSEIRQIKKEVWQNLGRNFAENAHFSRFNPSQIKQRVNIIGEQYLASSRTTKPVIFFTAHFSNWELANLILALKGFKMNSIYRPANNYYIDKKIALIRQKDLTINLHKKGRKGSVEFLKALKCGEAGGILIDQKYRKGISVDFLGKKAYSASLIADIAKKYEALLVPVHIQRLASGNFDFIVEKPLQYSDIKNLTTAEILLKLNKIIEKWIIAKPGEWFWVHDRWG